MKKNTKNKSKVKTKSNDNLKPTITLNVTDKAKYQVKFSPGVYMSITGTYAVRKSINGIRTYKSFTNKAKAIKYYNSL